jgi:hypothetical protein
MTNKGRGKMFKGKKLTVIVASSAIALAGLVLSTSTAQAAVKVNGTCTVARAKAVAAGNAVTCVANPASASGALIWGVASCVNAVKAYSAALAAQQNATTSGSAAVTKVNASIASVTADQASLQGKITKYNSDLQTFLAKNPSQANSTNVQIVQKAVAVLQKAYDRDTATLATLQTQLQAAQSSQTTLTQQATDNAKQTKTLAISVCKKGK